MGLWFMFFGGQIFNFLRRADFVARGRNNTINTVYDYVRANWFLLSLRIIIASILFSLWKMDALSLDIVGRFIPALKDVASAVDIPVTNGTAWLFGFSVDNLLDWGASHSVNMKRFIPEIQDIPK